MSACHFRFFKLLFCHLCGNERLSTNPSMGTDYSSGEGFLGAIKKYSLRPSGFLEIGATFIYIKRLRVCLTLWITVICSLKLRNTNDKIISRQAEERKKYCQIVSITEDACAPFDLRIRLHLAYDCVGPMSDISKAVKTIGHFTWDGAERGHSVEHPPRIGVLVGNESTARVPTADAPILVFCAHNIGPVSAIACLLGFNGSLSEKLGENGVKLYKENYNCILEWNFIYRVGL